ncbi:hypothetical protein HPTD01_350 [Halomonas sp. TD01]|nr:hypothetical protein GME_04982 [Halomonas sp. TD01]CAH1041872.1 hypothetical protein HPTD01_350 [Halomonas sp. TD01]
MRYAIIPVVGWALSTCSQNLALKPLLSKPCSQSPISKPPTYSIALLASVGIILVMLSIIMAFYRELL